MPLSQFGRPSDGVLIGDLALQVPSTGRIFYVCNNSVTMPQGIAGSDSNSGLSPEQPLSTIDAAINKCSASRRDTIVVLPGHVEAVTATSIVPDTAGVTIIGIGEGALKPTLNFGVTTSNIAVTAANVSIKGLLLKATVDSVVAGITVSAAGCTLDLETADTSSTVEFISAVVTASGCSNLNAKLRHRGFAAGDAMTRYVDLVDTTDANIDIDFFGIASTAVVNMRTTACNNIQVTGRFYNDSVALTKNVVDSTTSTWSVKGYDAKGGYDFVGSDDTTVVATPTTADFLSLPRSVASSAKTLTTGNVNMFTISGGPIKVLELVGIVTTVVQSQATSTKVTVTTTSPAATVDLSAAAVDLTGAAAGSSIRHINTTGILTVVNAGFVNEGNAFATQDTPYLIPAGTIQVNNASASNTGAITWYMRYVPLSPLSRVV